MSVPYGVPGSVGAGWQPPRKVNFGWINEAFRLFGAQAGIWILATLIVAIIPAIISYGVGFTLGAAHAALHSPSPYGSSPYGGSNPYGGSPYGGNGPGGASGMGGTILTNMLTSGLPPAVNIGLRVFNLAWSAFFYGGVYRMAVKQVRGEAIGAGDIFSGGPTFLSFLGFSLIYAIASGVGTLLCIIPGLIVASLMLPAYALLADGRSISAAISESNDGMKQDLWSGVGFVFVLGLLVVVSVIPCGLGLFVTIPMFWIVSALAYRDMIGMPTGGGFAPAASAPQTGPVGQSGVWPPPPSAGAQAQPPSFSQPPTSYGQRPASPAKPPPAPPTPAFNPFDNPPNVRRSLSGDLIDEKGNIVQPPNPRPPQNPPPGTRPPQNPPNTPPPGMPPSIG